MSILLILSLILSLTISNIVIYGLINSSGGGEKFTTWLEFAFWCRGVAHKIESFIIIIILIQMDFCDGCVFVCIVCVRMR